MKELSTQVKRVLELLPDKSIAELQQEFAAFYPFLRLDFYQLREPADAAGRRSFLLGSRKLGSAGLKKAGQLILDDTVTVAALEKRLWDDFGLKAQVIRLSGVIWLETNMTDSWTLFQQNQHGKEITGAINREIDTATYSPDQDKI